MRSLFEILDMKNVNKAKKISFHGDFKTIELQNVNFKYKTSSEYIIKNFNFTIKQGKIYAISGLNGAGKTTLIKLLLGFYKPNKGQVLINGVDINKYSSESILKNIACVFQPFIKYPLTVKENIKTGICYTDDNLLESIKEAAKMAGASDFIEHLPNQYDTMLQKEWSNGVEISLGQWQKLALVRAFF
ncbi:MAG: ABC transporter ATP-binding protein [Oscillospiraceae bacterium]|nr:ABC transporter ATP-binding protein [Oscillospiraceae bacterium]